jgi:Putative 2OG-Fe(II) oxygenase
VDKFNRRWLEASEVIPMFPMLLFPSYLEHSVDANTSDGERVSISFNLMFSSFAQQLSKPLW